MIEGDAKTAYIAPMAQIEEVELESGLLQMSQKDYSYGNLDE